MFKLNSKLTNEECIGKKVTALPECENSWVVCSDRDDEEEDIEEDYYRDVYGINMVTNERCCIYMYGETCKILGYGSKDGDFVIMENPNEGTKFKVSYDQYVADFGINWN